MLMKMTGDSYRGVLVSVGIDNMSGNMYFRCQFAGDSWRFMTENKIDHVTISSMMMIAEKISTYESESRTFVWWTDPTSLQQNISLYTILEDIFKRIDRISPYNRGTLLNVNMRRKFVEFIEKASRDAEDESGNKSKVIQVSRVMDALGMLESGVFTFDDADEMPKKEPIKDDDNKAIEPTVVQGVSKRKARTSRRKAVAGNSTSRSK